MTVATLIPLIRDLDYESSDVQNHLYITVSGLETFKVEDSKPVAPVTDFDFYLIEPYWTDDGIKHQYVLLRLTVDSDKRLQTEHKIEVYYKSKDFKNLLFSGTTKPNSSEISSTSYSPDTDTIIYNPQV